MLFDNECCLRKYVFLTIHVVNIICRLTDMLFKNLCFV